MIRGDGARSDGLESYHGDAGFGPALGRAGGPTCPLPGRPGAPRLTLAVGPFIVPSDQPGSETVTPFDIDTLEQQVDELIQICNRLREENTWLRARMTTLADDRAHLVEKTELARSKVESMISRLKSMEEDL